VFAALLAGMSGLAVRSAAGADLTFTVDSTADAMDADPGDDVCATAGGECTLRAAIMQANATPNDDTVVVPAGTYTLSIEGRDEYDARTGDLNILGDLVIVGAGSGSTIIQASATGSASGIDRVFDIRGDAYVVSISGVTIRRGNSGIESGGGMSVAHSGVKLTFDDVVITDNRNTNNSGPGLAAQGGIITFKDSKITNNQGGSAAIDVGNADLEIRTSTISGNVTNGYGAIAVVGNGSLLLERSTVNGNQGTIVGAIAIGGSNGELTALTIRNSTISGNTVTTAGNAIIRGRTTTPFTIESSTIAGNTGTAISATSAVAKAKNTIVAGNTKNCAAGSLKSLGHNLESGTSCGFTATGDLQAVNPLLGSLSSNGGPTKTRALKSGSPAIDAGSGCPDIDQRGNSRPKDGDSNGTATCDIGAYEAAKGTSPTPTSTPVPSATLEPTPEVTPTPSAAASEAPAPTPTAEPPAGTPVVTTGPAGTPAPSAGPASPSAVSGGDLTWLAALIALVILAGLVLALAARRRRRA